MTLKRKLAGLFFALLSVLALATSLLQGWTTMTDISAAIAFTLVGAIVTALYWSWKPEIDYWFAERNQPKLTVALTELKPEEKTWEVHIRCRNGEVISLNQLRFSKAN